MKDEKAKVLPDSKGLIRGRLGIKGWSYKE